MESKLSKPDPIYEGRPIRKGTVRAIIREAGASVEEFMGL